MTSSGEVVLARTREPQACLQKAERRGQQATVCLISGILSLDQQPTWLQHSSESSDRRHGCQTPHLAPYGALGYDHALHASG